MGNIIVGAIVFAFITFAAYHTFKPKKGGGCSGCPGCGCCPSSGKSSEESGVCHLK